jgi:hypothetical protein
MTRGFILIVAMASLSATAPAESNSTRRTTSKPQPAATTAQAAAAPPATLEQSATVPARVTFQNGQLSIVARNSTLGDILKQVQKLTGAEIEQPGNASERVVGSFGPGPARDVLSDLLYGSHYNYVVLGSETDPQAVAKIMLFPKTGGAADSAPTETAVAAYQGNNVAPQNMPRPFPGRPGMMVPAPNAAGQPNAAATDDADAQSDDDNSTDDSADDNNDNNDDQNAESTTVQGEEPADANQQQVRSPEQMLQELQQQQQQQQQNPNAPIMRPGFPPGIQPGVPPGSYPPGQQPGGNQQQ